MGKDTMLRRALRFWGPIHLRCRHGIDFHLDELVQPFIARGMLPIKAPRGRPVWQRGACSFGVPDLIKDGRATARREALDALSQDLRDGSVD